MAETANDLITGLFHGLNSLFGTKGTQNGSTFGRTGFDASVLPLFGDALKTSDTASQALRNQILGLTNQRRSNLSSALQRQSNVVQGLNNQEMANINTRYNSQQGAVRQDLVSRGLNNSTIAPGMQALVERERNRALGDSNARQSSLLGNIYGQQAQSLDNVDAGQMNLLSQLGFQDYGLRALLPQAIASSRTSQSSTQGTTRNAGLLERIFG
jgi:hypothetical protein